MLSQENGSEEKDSTSDGNAQKLNLKLRQNSNKTDSKYEDTHTNMYRLYNPNSGEHFYTASLYEATSVAAGWLGDGRVLAGSRRSRAVPCTVSIIQRLADIITR